MNEIYGHIYTHQCADVRLYIFFINGYYIKEYKKLVVKYVNIFFYAFSGLYTKYLMKLILMYT